MSGSYWLVRVGRAFGLAALYGFLVMTAMAVVVGIYEDTNSSLRLPTEEAAAWASALLLAPVILLTPDPFQGGTRGRRWLVAATRAVFGTLWFHHLLWFWSEGVQALHTENLWWLADPWVFLGVLLMQPERLEHSPSTDIKDSTSGRESTLL